MKTALWKGLGLSGLLLLAACDVVTTTAVVGELKAEEAQNAQQQMEKIQEDLDALQAAAAQHDAALKATLDGAPSSPSPAAE